MVELDEKMKVKNYSKYDYERDFGNVRNRKYYLKKGEGKIDLQENDGRRKKSPGFQDQKEMSKTL